MMANDGTARPTLAPASTDAGQLSASTGPFTRVPVHWAITAESQQWYSVLTHLRNYIQQICKSELVASDEEAQRIIISMVHCRDMTEVDAQMDRLLVRIGEVLAARTGDKTEFDRLVNLTRARGRTVFASHAKRHNFAAGDEAPRRKFIRS